MAQSGKTEPRRPVFIIGPLLMCSGACALLYQVVWVREFRLIFGASTAASAAVLAMFMGGLGAGGLILGKRVDKRRDPLMLYANLELGVALLAAASPFVLDAVRYIYSALGGTVALGMFAGTVIRLFFAALVLVPPTFLMGGTLPAAARAAETIDDTGRRNIGFLYGVNTLGAVMGAGLSTFFLLEVFGDRLLLWIGCLVNALIGLVARGISRGMPDIVEQPETALAKSSNGDEGGDADDESTEQQASDLDRDDDDSAEESARGEVAGATAKKALKSSKKGQSDKNPKVNQPVTDTAAPRDGAPPHFVLAAAAAVGFTFLLMELVFYRILGPVLGGSSYTFGLILAIALFGVGIGGAAYPILFAHRRVTISAFALTCVLEALGFAIPYALGDRLGLWAVAFRSFAPLGFTALAAGWCVIAAIVVLPAAIVSGLQFPLLIALLGKGQKDAGRHVGLAYGWNTAGAIVGSLTGGFGLIPLLTAQGVWRASILLLLALGVGAMVLSSRIEKKMEALAWPTMAAILSLVLIRTMGPTAALRHSPIGAGRANAALQGGTMNDVEDWLMQGRRTIVWEADGVESSVALRSSAGYAFVVNGKSDGHARLDAGTQIMGGLIGAFLHPAPRNALVVGLGTGSTAGWLGAVSTMERVDVVELEPAILRVARDCAPVNHNVMDNPKVHIFIGDAREVMVTTKQRYDVIFSEPSNPYRAGIASLFTAEFYQSATQRMAPGGIFLQWLQGYEVDGQTVRTVYATLSSVFPHVETWLTAHGDLVLAATREPIDYDVAKLRARLAEEPYRSAAANAWRVSDIEGVFAHYIANSTLAKAIAKEEGGAINTDDRNLLEFSFARMVGRGSGYSNQQIISATAALKLNLPEVMFGTLDVSRLEDGRAGMVGEFTQEANQRPPTTMDGMLRQSAFLAYRSKNYQGAINAWRKQPQAPLDLRELELVAHALAATGDTEAPAYIEKLRLQQPTEADALTAIHHLQKNELAPATEFAIKALEGYRRDPWPSRQVIEHLLEVVPNVALKDKALGRQLFDALGSSFAVGLDEETRLRMRMQLAFRIDFAKLCLDAVSAYEPHVPFRGEFLMKRLKCYTLNKHPLRARAATDVDDFYANEPPRFMPDLEDPTLVEDKPAPAPTRND